MPIDYVLYEMSYANMVLYGAVLPSYRHKDGGKNGGSEKRKKQEIIRADDPRNKEKVRQFFDSIE